MCWGQLKAARVSAIVDEVLVPRCSCLLQFQGYTAREIPQARVFFNCIVQRTLAAIRERKEARAVHHDWKRQDLACSRQRVDVTVTDRR